MCWKTKNQTSAVGLLVAAAIVASMPLACQQEQQPPPPTTQPAETPLDDNYIDALAAANQFLDAWKKCDYPIGKARMSRRLIRQYPESRLRDAVTGLPNPHHVAFEIFDGKRLPDGRIAFKIRLFYKYTGQINDKIEGPVQRIILAADDTGDWLVDEFPIP